MYCAYDDGAQLGSTHSLTDDMIALDGLLASSVYRSDMVHLLD